MNRKQQLSFLHFPGHLSNDLWYEFVGRIKVTRKEEAVIETQLTQTQKKESGCDKKKLLTTLIALAEDPKFESVFPSLVPVTSIWWFVVF